MALPTIHRNWELVPERLTDGFSLEITGRDEPRLRDAADAIPAETPVAITYLPGEALRPRVQAAIAVRELGCEPMPHFSARRIGSEDDFEAYLKAVVAEAGVRRCFVVAGDPAAAEGPYADSLALISTGAFERSGIEVIGIGGHPEGHPHLSEAEGWAVLDAKIAEIGRRGMASLIVTQFSFDSQKVLDWLSTLRGRGIDVPVRIGVPGPAGIKTLMKFAAYCGVGTSTAALKKYGVSLGGLLGRAGPEKLVRALEEGLRPEHGKVRLHFYPFGGLSQTVRWIEDYRGAS